MKKISVWIDKVALEALEKDEPQACVIQNRLDLDVLFSKPQDNMIACELMTFAYLKKEEPIGDRRLEINITEIENFTDADLQKIDEAKRIYNIVVNHPLYWKYIREAWANLTETKGYTYERFKKEYLSGDCKFTDADNSTDLQLVMYYKRWSKVVGYVLGDSNTIYINRKYFINPLNIASNLNHEALHLMGFSHYGNKSTSIPYKIGNDIFEKTWKDIIKNAAS